MRMYVARKFEFGKVAYGNPKRKANEVEIEVMIYNRVTCKYNSNDEFVEETDDVPSISFFGGIWNQSKTDYLSGGQNNEELSKFNPPKHPNLFKRLLYLWGKYHLKRIDEINDEDLRFIEDILDVCLR